MTRYVYTCGSDKLLNNHEIYEKVKSIPHITATKDMAVQMHSAFPELKYVEAVRVIFDEIVPIWNSMDTELQQFIYLSKAIREYDSDCDQNIKQSFMKNKRDLLNAIRTLVEADINPEDIQAVSEEQKLFSEIWWELEDLDFSIYKFRKKLKQLKNDKKLISDALLEVGFVSNSGYIILHGFYYITPLQERFFQLLEDAGYTLVFLADCGESTDGVSEIWEKTFRDKELYEWKFSGLKCTNDLLSEFYTETDKTQTVSNNVKIIKYHSEMDFVTDFRRLQEDGFEVYSPDRKNVDLLLKEFYPEAFQRRHLLSYPIGQYVYLLHDMWNDYESRIEIKPESVHLCFSSGWLTYKGENAKHFTSDLEKLTSYIQDCRTIQDWKNRIELIKDITNNIFPILEAHIHEKADDTVYYHKMMSNPLRNFSCFTVSNDRLEMIIGFLDKLITDIESLFGDGKTSGTNIKSHMKKLQTMICEGREELTYEEERIIVDELMNRFKFGQLDLEECTYGDVAEAIMLIAGSGIINEDEQCVDTDPDRKLVKPFVQIETTVITAPSKVHVCLADETRLPNINNSYDWPISDNLLDNLNCGHEQKRYIELYRVIHNNQILISRYLMSCALKNGCVEFSWIEEDDGKKLEKSPYLQLVEIGYGIGTEEYQKEMRDKTCQVRLHEHKTVTNKLKAFEEACIDEILCPWKYIYGYVLDEYPYYSSDFHYNFAISALIKSITSTAAISKDDAFRMVTELFPYLREVEKQQIYDFSNMKKNYDTTFYDDVIYPKARLNVHFLKENIMAKGLELLQKEAEGFTSHEEIPKQELCRYCSHIEYCAKVDRG